MAVQLGKSYRDIITGYEGIAVSRTEFLNGCVRVAIQAPGVYEGKPYESYVVDEPQLTELPTSLIPGGDMGGPQDTPSLPKILSQRRIADR